MAEPIFFATGSALSNDAVVEITPGTASGSLTAAEQVAKNRVWRLTAAANGANMPVNNYRGLVVVDATQSASDAYISLNSGNNPAASTAYRYCPAGMLTELWRTQALVGTEVMSVMLVSNDASGVIVTERSFV